MPTSDWTPRRTGGVVMPTTFWRSTNFRMASIVPPGRGDTGRTTGDVNTDHGGGAAAIARQGEEVVTERALTMGMGRPQSGCIEPHNVAK